VQEAAVYMGLPVWGMRHMIEVGRLPVVRNGRRILLDIRDMDAYIDQNKGNLWECFTGAR
jgi:excisionase family DNA binding protein